MKRVIKRLLLRRDTIRALSDTEHVPVGAGQDAEPCTIATRFASTCAGTLEPKPPK